MIIKPKKVAFYIGRKEITLINAEGLTLNQISEVNEDYLKNNSYIAHAKENGLYLVEYEVSIDVITKGWEFTLIDSKCWSDLKLDIAANA